MSGDFMRRTSILRFITHALLLMVLPAFIALFMSWSTVVHSSGEGAAEVGAQGGGLPLAKGRQRALICPTPYSVRQF